MKDGALILLKIAVWIWIRIKMQKFTHDELQHDLANHLRNKGDIMVWENMQIGPSGSPRPDVYAIGKTFTRFCPITYEIKISVSDFRSDITSGKWQSYLDFSSAVFFATPAGMITKADIPNGCGLIQRSESGWRVAKAPKLERMQSLKTDHWLKLLMGGIDREVKRNKYDPTRGHNRYEVEASVRKKFGEDVAKLISLALNSKRTLELAISEMQKQAEEIKSGTSRELKDAIQQAKNNEMLFRREFPFLIESLGINENAMDWQITQAIRNVGEKFSRDAEIKRLRSALETIQNALNRTLR